MASKMLVTGGAGFIGSHFVDQCINQGNSVVVLDALTYAGHPINLKNALGSRDNVTCELVEGDIQDRDLLESLFKKHQFQSVVHFAAESHVDRSITGPEKFIATNIHGTFELLTASLRHFQQLTDSQRKSFRYLQVSTDEVFGSLGPTGYFSETSPLQPNSPYSASKCAADQLVRAWFHTYGLPTITTHCSNNFGPRQFPEKLIPHMIDCARSGKPLPVYGDGQNIRDWIHVEDHAAGIHLALAHGDPGSTWCLGGRAEMKNIDLVKLLCAQLDELAPRKDRQSYQTQIQFVTDRLGHDRRYAIDDSKAEKELGFKRKHTFTTGLKDTIRWYLDSQDWIETVKTHARRFH